MSPARLGASLEDCRDCGRCCFDEDATYLPVFFVDLDRMSERTRAFTHEVDGRRYMALREGRCAALTIDPVAGTPARLQVSGPPGRRAASRVS